MPCIENKGCEDNCCKTETAQHDTNKDSTKSEDACSPFCVSKCCTPHFVTQDFSSTIKNIATVNTIYTQHTLSELPEVSLPIWQPPRLV